MTPLLQSQNIKTSICKEIKTIAHNARIRAPHIYLYKYKSMITASKAIMRDRK